MSVEEPKCLVAVPTFRRPQFLPRILACFDRLNYTNKKMVIINDDPDTKFIYNDDPRVEIINIDRQLQLSVKRNMFNCWDYDFIFPLDDDDLFLPDRLTNHINVYMSNGNTIDLYRNTSCYLVFANKLQLAPKSSFTNSSYSKAGFFKAGGYTSYEQSNLDDASLRINFTTKCKCHIIQDDAKIDFVYDYGGSRYRNTHNKESVMSDEFNNRTIKERGNTGEIILTPDYTTYDSIVSLCNKVTKDKPLNVHFANDNAAFFEV